MRLRMSWMNKYAHVFRFQIEKMKLFCSKLFFRFVGEPTLLKIVVYYLQILVKVLIIINVFFTFKLFNAYVIAYKPY